MNIDASPRKLACTWLFLTTSVLLSGCLSKPPAPPPDDVTSGGSTGNEEAAQACEDLAVALASSAARCGFDYQVNHDAFVKGAAGGDCHNIVMVRDADSLYDSCIPFLSNLTCEQLNETNVEFPDSCIEQLEH